MNLLYSKRLSLFVMALALGSLALASGSARSQGRPTGNPDSSAGPPDIPQDAQDKERMLREMPARPLVPIYDPGLPVSRKVLKNGVVLLVQEQRTSERVAATVALRMGLLYEDETNAGLSQVVLRALTAGTKKIPPAELQLRLLAHKTALESGIGPDFGQVGLEMVRESTEPLLALLAEVVLTPSFPDTAVENARSYFLARASEDLEDPILGSYSNFLSTMYRGSPFARPPHGTVQALSEARRSDVLTLYRKLFVGGNMAVSVVGNLDGKKVLAQLERLFAGAPPGPPPKPVTGEPQPLPADTLISAERSILAQPMVFGFPAPGYADRDYPAFMVLDSYLRSGDRSPITFWMEQRGQADFVRITYPPYPRRSSMAVSLGTEPAKYHAARDTVAAVLARLATEPLDDQEWNLQVKRVQRGFFWKQNDPAVRARHLSRWEIQGLTLDYPRNFETALLQLKPDDVRAAAARWFTHAAEVTLKPSGRDGQQ